MVALARSAIESMYVGTCNISEMQETTDSIRKITTHSPKEVLKNQPCRLSFKTIVKSNETGTGAVLAQEVKLFLSPDIVVKPGSKITVTQNGFTRDYKNSGEPACFSSHQEIVLELFKGWS